MAGRKSSAGRKSTGARKSTAARKSKAGGPRKSKAAGGPRKSKAGSTNRHSVKSTGSGKLGHHGEKKVSEVDVPYAPTTLTVSSIEPFFLLLRSQERSLVLKALNSIYKHIKYNFNDVKLMYERTFMEDVKELSQVNEKCIPDSAIRLLALVTKDPNSHTFLTSDASFMKFLYEHVSSKTDVQAKYCSKILADLTLDVEVVQRMLEDGSGFEMKNLINNLSHHNADVCHNTMIIIGNIFHDLKCAEKFVNQKEFSFVPLFNLLEKEYIEVQKKALTLIEWLGCQKKTTELKTRFIDQKGVERMFGVLTKFGWRDIHEQALRILRVYLEDDEERMRTLEQPGVAKFVNYIDFIENDDLIATALGNILDIASTVFGKLELVALGFVPKVTSMLSDGTVEMKLGACNVINEMLRNTDTVRLFTELAPMKELVDIVVDPDHSWELIGAALGVLHNLAKFSSDMAFILTQQPLRKLFKEWMMTHLVDMPIKYKNVMYDLMSVMVQHSLVRPLILEFPFVWAFLLGLRDIDPRLHHVQTVSAEALVHIIPQEKYARQFIVATEGMEIVTRALFHAKDNKLISMLCNVVRVAAENDQNMLISLLKNHVLEWLVKKRRMWTEIEAMEWAATALQNQFLPAKFEYRGRLTFNDITQNGFYIRKEYDIPQNLPIPPSRADEDARMPYSIYLSNFELEKDQISPEKAQEMYKEKLKNQSKLDDKCASTYGMEYEDTDEECIAFDLSEDPLYIQKCLENQVVMRDDERLIALYEEVKKILAIADEKSGPRDYSMPFDHSWVLSRVEALVDVVSKALSGTESRDPCHQHSMNLYVEELKTDGKTGVIPLGNLEMGGSLERALLFKILADKVGLPCSLWRGTYGNGWNEIPLLNLGAEFPMRNKEETKVKTEDKPEMPTRLMYATHVVDLVEKAGRLLEVGSPEAQHYTGRPVQSVLYKVPESNPPPIDTCLIKLEDKED